jgi:hypothetical protein
MSEAEKAERTMPTDFDDTAAGERGKGWRLLYELYGELPVPEREVWKIAAMLLRAEARIADLTSQLEAMQELIETLRTIPAIQHMVVQAVAEHEKRQRTTDAQKGGEDGKTS